MGAAASTIPDKVSLEQFKTIAGDRFDMDFYDINKDADGFLTKDQLMQLHASLTKQNRYKLKSPMILVELYQKYGDWTFKIVEPRTVVRGDEEGCIETVGEKMTYIGKFSNDVIETYWLKLADGSGWIAGWKTTYRAKCILEMFVTDVDEKPIVVHPLPPEPEPKPRKPKPTPKSPDDAAKAIQQAAKKKAEYKRNPPPKPPPKIRPKKKEEPTKKKEEPTKKKEEPTKKKEEPTKKKEEPTKKKEEAPKKKEEPPKKKEEAPKKKEEPPKKNEEPAKPKHKKFKALRQLNAVGHPESDNKVNGVEIEQGAEFEVKSEKQANGMPFAELANGKGWVCIGFKETAFAEAA